MPTAQALRICPDLILVRGNMELYSKLSRQVFAVAEKYSPVIEKVSIDEAYLDMTGTTQLFGPPEVAAQRLRAEIRATTGLAASIGIGANRLIAKVATDAGKPDNYLLVKSGQEAEFLAPFPVRTLPGVGKSTEAWLHGRGIFKLGELQRFPREALERHLGSYGTYLHASSLGQGSITFNEEAKTRSVSREITFGQDLADLAKIKKVLWELSSDVARSLREEGEYGRTVKMKLRYPPFETVHRSRVMKAPAHTDQAVFEAAEALLDDHWDGRPLRLIGIGCVMGEVTQQLDLFADPHREVKREKLDTLKDELRRRFGDKAVLTGRDLDRK